MSESVWERIEAARERNDVLRHPFYLRWSAGELSAEELAGYSGQYRHAVVALAELSAYAAESLPEHPELVGHASEEREHVAVWDEFVRAVDGDPAAAPTPQTTECSASWSRRDGALAALGRLYAIESGQPQISETKLEGLRRHYGVDSPSATRYFTIHRGRDVEHAAEGRVLLEGLIGSPAEEDLVVAAAEDAFRANLKLLDGVLADPPTARL